RTTPPVAVVARIVERAIVVVAVATRKGGKHNSHSVCRTAICRQ
ncbi:unnamed protein product, partial [marine sediment metagenome]